MRQYFKRFRADLVIHWQTLGNDVWNNIFPTHDTASMNGAPKPTFRLKGEQLIEPAQQIGQPAFRWRLWALIVHGVWGGLDAFWEMYLPPPYVPRESVLHIQGGERVSTEENLKSEKSHWSILLTPASPRMEYGISLTRQLLRTMEEIASTQGAQFIIFQEDRTTPLARKACEKFPWHRNGHFVVEYEGKFYEADSEQYALVRKKLNDGFRYLSIPITVPSHTVGPANCHLNVEGNRQVLKDLAATLRWRGTVLSHSEDGSNGG